MDYCLEYLKHPGRAFVNPREAEAWIAKAEAAQGRTDLPGMRSAVSGALDLLPPDRAEAAKEQAARSGLRGT